MRTSRWALGIALLAGPELAWALPPGPGANQAGRVVLSASEAKACALAVAPAAAHNTGASLTAPGRITYEDLRVAHVVSPVSGRVVKVLAQPGDVLPEGAILATIASPDLATSVSDLRKAAAALDVARRDLRRQESLYAKQAVPEQVVLAAWDGYRRAQSEMSRAQATWRLLHGLGEGPVHPMPAGPVPPGTYALRAPIAGVVVGRSVSPGAEVAGQYGGGSASEMFSLADLSQVWVYAEVHEDEVGRLKMAGQVQVRADAVPGRVWQGVVSHISEVLDPVTRVAAVRVVMDNADGALKPDMFVAVSLDTTGLNSLTVARCSVVHLGDAAFVIVAGATAADGSRTFERRHVQVDEALGEAQVPVTFGLSANEQVVTHGIDALLTKLEALR